MGFRCIRVGIALVATGAGLLHGQGSVKVMDLTGEPVAVSAGEFSGVSQGIELGSGGFVFVDPAEVKVYLVNFRQGRVNGLGGMGEGPGEYRRPTAAYMRGLDGAVILDLALGRALMISPDGSIGPEVLTRDAVGGISPASIRGIDARGNVIHAAPAAGGGQDSIQIRRYNMDAKQSTVVGWWPMLRTNATPATIPGSSAPAQVLSSPVLWQNRTAWVAMFDGSVAIVRPDPYRVDVIGSSGAVTRGPVVQRAPVRVTAAFKDSIRSERGPVPDNMFPETLPPFEGLGDVFASPDNQVWVKRLSANGPYPTYDVFDHKGVLAGEARLRPRSRIVGLGVGTVYVAREVGSDGFWVVDKYAVR